MCVSIWSPGRNRVIVEHVNKHVCSQLLENRKLVELQIGGERERASESVAGVHCMVAMLVLRVPCIVDWFGCISMVWLVL